MVDGRRREAVGNEDLHRERLGPEAGEGRGSRPGAEGWRSEVGLVRGGLGGDLADGVKSPEAIEIEGEVDGSAADRLVPADLPRNGVGGTWAGVLEAVERRRGRHELLELPHRVAEQLRPAPRRSADDRVRAVAGEDSPAKTPLEKLPRRLAAMDFAERLVVVGAGVEVREHPVGVEGDVHEVGSAGRSEELGCRLLSLEAAAGMERVAAPDPHRQAEELPQKEILETGEEELEVVGVGLRADEAGDVVDHERIVAPRQAVAEGLGRRHVDPLVAAVGELAPLAGLEVHRLRCPAVQRPAVAHREPAPVEEVDRHVKLGSERRFGASEALKKDLDRGAGIEGGKLRLDVGEDTDLCRSAGMATEAVEEPEHRRHVLDGVDRRIDAEQRVAGGHRQAPPGEQRDPARVVGGMVRLEP